MLAQTEMHDGSGATDRAMEARACSRSRAAAARRQPERHAQWRETVEHPFGTIKARMGATHFLMKTLPKVAAEMALHVLAYN